MHAALQMKPEAKGQPAQRAAFARTAPRRHESGARATKETVELDGDEVADLQTAPDANQKAPRLKQRTLLQRKASSFEEHLNGLFAPLKFPPELARRILTHGSHPKAVAGHNAGFTFMGRRVLKAYLLLFLSSSPNLRPSHDLEAIVDKALNTYLLGEHVGNKWGLGRNMLWQPTVPRERIPGEPVNFVKTSGLYKVQGDCVAAILGGIFHQFGGSVAHRVFHTRLLPRLLDDPDVRVLPEAFHEDVRRARDALGGGNAPLLSSDAHTAKVSPSIESNVNLA
ncbi:ribonuclease-III-like-domain-containing protein [Schizophyllum commune]